MNSCLNVPVVSYYHHHLNINLGYGTFVVYVETSADEYHSSPTLTHIAHIFRSMYVFGMEVPIKMNGFQKGT